MYDGILYDDIPIVKVFKIKAEKDNWWHKEYYYFWCPFCNRFHKHPPRLVYTEANCVYEDSPFIRTGYILKEYTKKELEELGLPINYYEKSS